jgi:polysaccharide biosynthesis transport protein
MSDMSEPEQEAPPPGLRLDDIYFVLFRHKWMILLFSAAGVLAAGILYLTRTPTYQSEAKLLVLYVQENRSVNPVDNDAQIKTPDIRGENILNTELEILRSLDLAAQVADLVGPEKITPKVEGLDHRMQAAITIRKTLKADSTRNSSVIQLTFQHSNPEVVQPVLRHLIDCYKKKHFAIHRGGGTVEEYLSQQTDQLRSRLSQTDEALRKLKAKAGVISLDDTRKAYIEQLSKIQQELFSAEAELAERKAGVAEIEKNSPEKFQAAATDLGVPLDKLNEYKRLCAQAASLQTNHWNLLAKFRDDNPVVERVRDQLGEAEAAKKKLEGEYPKLGALGLDSTPASTAQINLAAERSRLKALEAKIGVYSAQLDKIRRDANGLEEAESSITELQRQKAMEESHLLSFAKNLERARLEETLGAGKITNINEVQTPSPAAREASGIKKLVLGVLVAGLLVGLGLAFGYDLFLDRSVKRPSEIEAKLNLPLFFTLPALRLGHSNARKRLPLSETESDGHSVPVHLWNGNASLRPHFEALRDRLIHYFEIKNMTHKPKLVAVAGCAAGVGTSTIAKGLAMALSEAGDGNILLVDMTSEAGSAHSFFKSKGACGLAEVLENETRDSGMVSENLYVATVNDGNEGPGGKEALPRILPKRFGHLVPKMKASDYDYIIFDLPPINQRTITPRLAGFMDIVIEVVQAEKTSGEVVKRAAKILTESNANVAVMLNHTRKYIPDWLHQEL